VILTSFNLLASPSAQIEFLRCCGSSRWAEEMASHRPFHNSAQLFAVAEEIWRRLSSEDWREAFSHHPKIGDMNSLRAKFAGAKGWAEGEQAGVQSASDEILQALAAGNEAYEKKFGYIFIVCATGKNAEEMLSLLRQRLPNDPAREIQIAVAEQAKITKIRLEKLLARA